jgi:hypothetical protein
VSLADLVVAAAAVVTTACGARTGGLGDEHASPPQGGSPGGGYGGVESVSAGGGGGEGRTDASSEPPEPGPYLDGGGYPGYDEAGPGPTSCDDVGKYPGLATCCKGEYCAGYCNDDLGVGCACASVLGGCIWPAVCCGGVCTSPTRCNE